MAKVVILRLRVYNMVKILWKIGIVLPGLLTIY